jgi:hypothetical protein
MYIFKIAIDIHFITCYSIINRNEKDYIMTQSTADRMALIPQAAQKFQKTQTKQARFVRQEVTPSKAIMDNSDSMLDERYYTDASKYANEYYGEVYRETTKFDYDDSKPAFANYWDN